MHDKVYSQTFSTTNALTYQSKVLGIMLMQSHL